MQTLANAMLSRPDLALTNFEYGELHYYLAFVESRDLAFAWTHVNEAERYMTAAREYRPEDAETWLRSIEWLKQRLSEAEQQDGAAAQQTTATDGVLGEWSSVGQAVPAATETTAEASAEAAPSEMGQTFTLSFRPR